MSKSAYSKPNYKENLVYGVGVCDAPTRINGGKQTKDYNVWFSMIRRVNGNKELARNPTYKGCSIDTVWLKFSRFQKDHAKKLCRRLCA